MKPKMLTIISFFMIKGALFAAPQNVVNTHVETVISQEVPKFLVDYLKTLRQTVHTRNWKEFSYSQTQIGMKETFNILFPPGPSESHPPVYQKKTDNEGMTFQISGIPIPGEDFDLQKYMDFLRKTIDLSSNIQVHLYTLPENNKKDPLFYIIDWFNNNGTFTQLTAIKGGFYIYFLEATVTNELYKDGRWYSEDEKTIKRSFKDTHKASLFRRSFSITNSFG